MKAIAYLLIASLTLSVHAKHDDKNPKNTKNSRPLNIFNYIYSNSKSEADAKGDAKNKPLHATHQESKMKHLTSSSFLEKLLSLAAAGVGVTAGTVYIIKSVLSGKGGQSTAALKKDVERLRSLLINMSKQANMQKIKELLSKIHIFSRKIQK